MKQSITREQFKEITDIERSRWFDWALKHKYATVKKKFINKQGIAESYSEMELPTIGQMIEFLEEYNPYWDIHPPQKGELNEGDLEHKDDDKYWEDMDMSNPYDWQVETNSVGSYNTRELSDALWEAVKEILIKNYPEK